MRHLRLRRPEPGVRRSPRQDPVGQRPDRRAQPRALRGERGLRRQPDGLPGRGQDRGPRGDGPRARGQGTHRRDCRRPGDGARRRPAPGGGRSHRGHHHGLGVPPRRRDGAQVAAPLPVARARLPLRRERREPGLPRDLRPRPGRQRRGALGDGGRGQAPQVPGDVPQGRPRAADQGGPPAPPRLQRRGGPGRARADHAAARRPAGLRPGWRGGARVDLLAGGPPGGPARAAAAPTRRTTTPDVAGRGGVKLPRP